MATLGEPSNNKEREHPREEVMDRDRNTHKAILISKRIVGLSPITRNNIIHFQDSHEENMEMAEKRTACEYISHYLSMGRKIPNLLLELNTQKITLYIYN